MVIYNFKQCPKTNNRMPQFWSKINKTFQTIPADFTQLYYFSFEQFWYLLFWAVFVHQAKLAHEQKEILEWNQNVEDSTFKFWRKKLIKCYLALWFDLEWLGQVKQGRPVDPFLHQVFALLQEQCVVGTACGSILGVQERQAWKGAEGMEHICIK